MQTRGLTTAAEQYRQHRIGLLPPIRAKHLLQHAELGLRQGCQTGTGQRGLPLQRQYLGDVTESRRPFFVRAAVIAAVTAVPVCQVLPQALHFGRQLAFNLALHHQAIPLHPQQQRQRIFRQMAHIQRHRSIAEIVQRPCKHIEKTLGNLLVYLMDFQRGLVLPIRRHFLRGRGTDGLQLRRPQRQQASSVLRQGGKHRLEILLLQRLRQFGFQVIAALQHRFDLTQHIFQTYHGVFFSQSASKPMVLLANKA